jgi:hypothetical protein
VDSFDYLAVLLSVILGLAIEHVLQGFRGLILTRGRVKLYTPTLIWAGLTLLFALQGWWASFAMRTYVNWTFMAFFVIILHSISIYMGAALVLPELEGETFIDLREHYFAHKRWFFGALLAQVVLSAAKELVLYGRLLGRTNGEFHLIFALAVIAGGITQREWFHKFLAPACCLLYLLYIVLLFARL